MRETFTTHGTKVLAYILRNMASMHFSKLMDTFSLKKYEDIYLKYTIKNAISRYIFPYDIYKIK